METTTKPLKDLAQELADSKGITIKVMKANSMNKPDWAKQEWLIHLSCEDRSLTFPYYGGGAVTKPDLTNALWVLGIEYLDGNDDFIYWARELDLSLDSIRARDDFNSMQNRSRELDYLLGDPALSLSLRESAREF